MSICPGSTETAQFIHGPLLGAVSRRISPRFGQPSAPGTRHPGEFETRRGGGNGGRAGLGDGAVTTGVWNASASIAGTKAMRIWQLVLGRQRDFDYDGQPRSAYEYLANEIESRQPWRGYVASLPQARGCSDHSPSDLQHRLDQAEQI